MRIRVQRCVNRVFVSFNIRANRDPYCPLYTITLLVFIIQQRVRVGVGHTAKTLVGVRRE